MQRQGKLGLSSILWGLRVMNKKNFVIENQVEVRFKMTWKLSLFRVLESYKSFGSPLNSVVKVRKTSYGSNVVRVSGVEPSTLNPKSLPRKCPSKEEAPAQKSSSPATNCSIQSLGAWGGPGFGLRHYKKIPIYPISYLLKGDHRVWGLGFEV